MSDFKDKISLLFPAYLNGTLSLNERQQVEDAIEQDPEVAADFAFQKKLKEAVKNNIDDTHMPGELGWARLSKAMQETESSIANDNADSLGKPKFWRYAAAVLAVATIAQAGVIGSSVLGDRGTQQYITVSDNAVTKNSFKLAFNSDATESEIRNALLEVEGNIIFGPSKLGLYDVVFSSKAACDSAVEILTPKTETIKAVSVCN